MQGDGLHLQSRGSQHGFQGAVIEGNASRERLKSMDETLSHNGVLVTTTLNVRVGPKMLGVGVGVADSDNAD